MPLLKSSPVLPATVLWISVLVPTVVFEAMPPPRWDVVLAAEV